MTRATNKVLKAARHAARVGLKHSSRVSDVHRAGPGTCVLFFDDGSQQEVTGTVGGHILSGDLEAVKRCYL